MPEGYINVLFQKGLTLDDIIHLLRIEKLDMQQPKNQFFNVCGQHESIEVPVIPLYVLVDVNGREYYI